MGGHDSEGGVASQTGVTEHRSDSTLDTLFQAVAFLMFLPWTAVKSLFILNLSRAR